MQDIIQKAAEALLMAFGMFWKTGWSLVVGLAISACCRLWCRRSASVGRWAVTA